MSGSCRIDGSRNAYDCTACGHVTPTIIRGDGGTTPFMISCPMCGGAARSRFYARSADLLDPTHEWFSPKTSAERRALKKAGKWDRAHFKAGGLFMRPIPGE